MILQEMQVTATEALKRKGASVFLTLLIWVKKDLCPMLMLSHFF